MSRICDMTDRDAALRDAMEILGILPEDSAEAVKRKYRRMLRLSHPDEEHGSDEEVRRVIAAYETVKRSDGRWQKQRTAAGWKQKLPKAVPEAFCERTFFRTHDIFGEESGAYAAGRGRFLWDPDLEEFGLYTRSIRLEALRILQEQEEAAGIYDPDDLMQDGRRAACLLKIFHLLIQEYIEPWTCLQKIQGECPPAAAAGPPGASQVPAGFADGRIGATDRQRQAAAAYLADPSDRGRALLCIMEGTRLYVKIPGVGKALLSFDEDCMHYLYSMMMARGAAIVSARIRSTGRSAANGRWKGQLPVTVRADITDEAEARRTGRGRGLIEQAVREYAAFLSELQ